jgi:glutamate-1-semialdehyde aminotransferase
MRIARTVTARSLIVAFSGSYHGIFDEVLVRGTQTFRSVPAAAGIMPEAVENMLILDYGTDETLKIIRERAHELAAVLVEPVQSRRPEFQPVEFLKEVRRITERSGTVLIFDEVITGFRMHPGGTQALFDIKADIASYGKVIGGGLPIGVIAGKREFMDALDGGAWQFGDNSTPEVGVTYFAGTFVRHPLALIAAKTSLEYFKQRGPTLQQELNDKTAWLVDSMTKICLEFHIPVKVVSFGSLWRLKYTEEVPYGDLLFTLMRFKGIHILDGLPCFVTESNTPVELKAISDIFKESIIELIKGGFLLPDADKSVKFVRSDGFDVSPIPGAKLGRDGDGNPAWFIENPEQPGKYMQVKLRG